MTSFNLSNASPEARDGFFHALRLHAAGKDERRTYKRVQLAKEGDHPTGGSAERKPFTRATFDAILASATDAVPSVGISHKKPAANGDNGTPSLASIRNVTVDTDPRDGKAALYGDLEDLPVWAAEEYPRRSVELMVYPDGRTVLTRLALLGDEAAAIPDLEQMPEGVELIAAAAVEGTIAATTSPEGDTQPASSPDNHEQEESGMTLDPKLVARRLGLSEDTTLEDLTKFLETEPETAETQAEATTEETTTSEAEETAETGALALTAAAQLAPETVAQIQADAAELREYRNRAAQADAEQRRAVLDAEIARVVKGGGFHKDTGAVYVTAAAADFDGTIAQLKAHPLGLIAPVDGERGHSIEAAASSGMSEDDAVNKLRELRGQKPEA